MNRLSSYRLMLMAALLWTAPVLVHADKRPPGDMIGDGVEVPVLIVPAAGGISSATPVEGIRSVNASLTVGEALSGRMQLATGDCLGTNEPCTLDMGYDLFEFYSDRIPVSQLTVTLNNGETSTNVQNVNVHVDFKDDLSGLRNGSVTDPLGHSTVLDLSGSNTLTLSLPAAEGDYPFDFTFEDRAGNITAPAIRRNIRLDQTPPLAEAIKINDGALFTSRSTVTVTIDCIDAPGFPTQVTKVRVATDPNRIATGRMFPFVETRTSFNYYFGDETLGLKTVFAQCGDTAGNWSTGIVGSSITRGNYSPGGTITVVRSTTVVDGPDGIPQTDQSFVGVKLNWNPLTAGSLHLIHVNGFESLTYQISPGDNPPLLGSIRIADNTTTDGIQNISAVFEDLEGNLSAEATAQVRLNRNPLPIPEIASYLIDTTSITLNARIVEINNITTFVFTPTIGIDRGADAGVVTVPAPRDTVTFVDVGLQPNTRYSYTVQSRDLLHLSAISTWEPRFTLAASPALDKPAIAREIFLIHVFWGPNGNPGGTEYFLQYATKPDFSDAIDHDSDWSTTLERDVTGLLTGTKYYFRVKARNGDLVETGWLDLVPTSTLNFDYPLAPTLFTAETVNPTDILWRWTRAANNTEEGYLLQDEGGHPIDTITVLKSTPSLTYHETGLTPNTVEKRSLLAFNHLNSTFTRSPSLYAEPEAITPPMPPTPDHLTAKGSEIAAFWGANTNPNYTEYMADISANKTFTDKESSEWIKDTTFLFRGLRPSTSYYVRVSARGLLHNGTQIIVGPVDIGSVATETYDHNGELDLSNFSNFWRLKLPAGLISQDFGLSIEVNPAQFPPSTQDLIRRATEKSKAETNGLRFPIPGGLIQIAATSIAGEPIDPPLKNQAELMHLFGDIAGQSSGGGLQAKDWPGDRPTDPAFNAPVDGQKDVRFNTLRIWALDPETESWVRLPGNSVDLNDSQVNGHLIRFGVFSVMGSPALDVDQVIAYPVPWRPNGPNAGLGAGQTGTEANGIRFTDIPQEGKVTIYDLRGARVRELHLDGNVFAQWDGRNEDGTAAQSGTYLWVAESSGHRKTGKLVVIR